MNYNIFQPLTSFGNSDANLYEVGYQHCDPGYSITDYLPPHHVIHFIVHGHGWMRTGGRTYELGPGEGMFSTKHVPVDYIASKTDPWYYVWLHFSGVKLEKYLHEIRLSKRSPIFRVDDPAYCGRQIEDLFRVATQCEDQIRVEAYGLGVCYGLFAQVLQANQNAGASAEEAERPQAAYVERAIHYIGEHLGEELRMTQVASAVGLNPNYLCSLFRTETGLSIQEYMIRLRMQTARRLLMDVDNSVADVARMVGYKNSASFCKAFKKTYHITPGTYR